MRTRLRAARLRDAELSDLLMQVLGAEEKTFYEDCFQALAEELCLVLQHEDLGSSDLAHIIGRLSLRCRALATIARRAREGDA